ncbi:uncharacterized protein AFUA_8G01980 [Aspergillus fumigatus Af293]|uniref:SMP-30/Gluconolactonase/LRE-like region domain-containing protein n=3 Tax=Aspergillus fumigatus TaxID=746128 RepID=Q4WBE2_ASPFU|nr:conserved hypothetical protein [Aspergillus fumigatus Af293]EAL84970.1 conserved hypothetical protein [Aspergillus fumigatus Af293]EDP49012.1 conserved hypothetical protein [Aspergillus fumigatus A1163]
MSVLGSPHSLRSGMQGAFPSSSDRPNVLIMSCLNTSRIFAILFRPPPSPPLSENSIMYLTQSLTLVSLATSTLAFQIPDSKPPSTKHTDDQTTSPVVRDIFQFPDNGSFIDNIAVRPDGTLLLTRIDVPEVWAVDPQTGSGELAYSFAQQSSDSDSNSNSDITAVFGITEVEHDVFAVVAGKFALEGFAAEQGSFGVWKLDFNDNSNYDVLELPWWGEGKFPLTRNTPSEVSKIVDIPEAKALGASTLYKPRHDARYLLISDSPDGMIWRVDLDSGEYAVALQDESMLPAPDAPPMGVNGIHVVGEYLHYVSVTKKEYRRVKIDENANAAGPFELITSEINPDSFDITDDGTAYFATNPENTIVKYTPEGEIVDFAGGKNSTVLPGPTCCALDKKGQTLYVGTNGGLMAPVGGTYKEPGKIAAISL